MSEKKEKKIVITDSTFKARVEALENSIKALHDAHKKKIENVEHVLNERQDEIETLRNKCGRMEIEIEHNLSLFKTNNSYMEKQNKLFARFCLCVAIFCSLMVASHVGTWMIK